MIGLAIASVDISRGVDADGAQVDRIAQLQADSPAPPNLSLDELDRWSDEHSGFTILRAKFERTSEECFALGGAIMLRDSAVHIWYPGVMLPRALHAELPVEGGGDSAADRVSPRESIARALRDALSVEGGRMSVIEVGQCRIKLFISKEVLQEGRWIALSPWDPRPHKPVTIRPGETIRLEDGTEWVRFGIPRESSISFPDAIMGVGARFYSDPLPACLRASGLFAITPAGLRIQFPEHRSELAFAIEKRASLEDRSVSLIFSTPSCRVTIKVQKEINQPEAAWVPLAPLE